MVTRMPNMLFVIFEEIEDVGSRPAITQPTRTLVEDPVCRSWIALDWAESASWLRRRRPSRRGAIEHGGLLDGALQGARLTATVASPGQHRWCSGSRSTTWSTT